MEEPEGIYFAEGALDATHTSVFRVRRPTRCCKKRKAGIQKGEMRTTASERDAAVDSKTGTGMHAPLQVIKTGQEVVSRSTGRHDQESSGAYLPKGTRALSLPYPDLGSLLARVPLGHSRSASLATSARVYGREVGL